MPVVYGNRKAGRPSKTKQPDYVPKTVRVLQIGACAYRDEEEAVRNENVSMSRLAIWIAKGQTRNGRKVEWLEVPAFRVSLLSSDPTGGKTRASRFA